MAILSNVCPKAAPLC